MTFTIRRLARPDAGPYRALRLQALRDYPEAFASAYETALEKPQSDFADLLEKLAFFGAFVGDRLVGIVAFDRSAGDKEKHRGWLLQMYVQPQMRGTGCALALVETLLDHAREQVIQVHLGVASSNEPAIRLYKKAGFVIYGTDPRFLFVNGRYIDEYQMVRFLDEGTRKAQT